MKLTADHEFWLTDYTKRFYTTYCSRQRQDRQKSHMFSVTQNIVLLDECEFVMETVFDYSLVKGILG